MNKFKQVSIDGHQMSLARGNPGWGRAKGVPCLMSEDGGGGAGVRGPYSEV